MVKGKIIFTFLTLILVNAVIAEQITLEVGESQETNGVTVKLKNLKSDKAVISVNDDSKILEEGDLEQIGPVKVKLLELFYAGTSVGSVNLEVTPLFECGDNICDGPETKSSCCQDCGCQSGYDCVDNECVVHTDDECKTDSECDDENQDTLDLCRGTPKKCDNLSTLICSEDSDCNDNNPCTQDSCTNNDCFNELMPNCESKEENLQEDEEIQEDINVEQEENNEEQYQPEEKLSPIKRILKLIIGFFVKEK